MDCKARAGGRDALTPSNWSLPHIYLSHLLSPLFFIYYIYYPTTPFVMRISGPGDCPGHLLFPSVCVYCCTIYSRLAGLNPPCRFTSDVYPWRLFHFISHIYIFLFLICSLFLAFWPPLDYRRNSVWTKNRQVPCLRPQQESTLTFFFLLRTEETTLVVSFCVWENFLGEKDDEVLSIKLKSASLTRSIEWLAVRILIWWPASKEREREDEGAGGTVILQ